MLKRRDILVAEHETPAADAIKATLERHGEFAVDVVPPAQDALRRLASSLPDALLLDTTLPDMSTFEVCGVLRSRERTRHLPCIMLGDPSRGVGVIDGLELGADDYLVKPLDPCEVEARLKAVLRRRPAVPAAQDAQHFKGAHLDVNFTDVSVCVNGAPITLTRREFMLLRALIGAKEQVLDRHSLLAAVWGTGAWDCRVVDSAMWKLRAKLRPADHQIETVVGFGYRFTEPQQTMSGKDV